MYIMNEAIKLIDFINASPTAYHTIETAGRMLEDAGYSYIPEGDASAFGDGGKHYTVRNGSSIIAFHGKGDGFTVVASHSDTPTFRVKSSSVSSPYTRLNVEKYGGSILYSWLDRPLSVAGRVAVRTDEGIRTVNVDLKRDYAVIPSVAIHMNRSVNDGYKFNPATDMLPLSGLGGTGVLDSVAEALGVSADKIVSEDLYLYNRDGGRLFGAASELILSSRLDNLGCAYASLRAFIDAEETDQVSVLAIFDNEEVGSATKQGAASTFLRDTLYKIAGSDARYYAMLDNSYMVSADNAHAKHPNHPELSDTVGCSVLGGGVVVKYNASQRYTTDAVSDGIFRTVADRIGASVQSYYNRADMPGGSTLGSISNTVVSIPTIDIGLPQLAMHSASEICAVSDVNAMISVLTELYSTSIRRTRDGFDLLS